MIPKSCVVGYHNSDNTNFLLVLMIRKELVEVDDNIKTPGGAAKCNDEEPNSDNTNFLLVLIILKILSLLIFKI